MNARLLLASGVLAIAVIVGVFALSSSKPVAPVARIAAANPARTPAPAAQTSTQPSAQPSTPPKDEPFVIKRILPIEGAIKYGDWHWDEAEVPAGPIVVTVDLDARVLSVFRGGYEIGTTAVLLGTEDTPTPLGVFPITEKDKDHVSNIYTGAPMPYMQRLTNDGITLHGSKVELGYASHGCVGMPVDFAAKLFATTKVGDKVYITRGKQVGLGDDLAGA
ncbi:lipoprotein-anchoring transpeptidase ErfK/SrfK [Novosphingobium sp. PhB55]|uniref:L,D-transpeptidase family protein n=1 Tax=Novosphingobium sp. PhB55 TaxID=2485106 RepID=UPI001065F90E|nr:L,D-transpeptidase family protein [Novosphingobium sp. PhB55]TDW63386.1 lipoprotein-anchoring transpeptidase ErfK/SrfK [Novosphingobium sp. PhB55]